MKEEGIIKTLKRFPLKNTRMTLIPLSTRMTNTTKRETTTSGNPGSPNISQKISSTRRKAHGNNQEQRKSLTGI
jgi:hypothetical protein